MNEHKTPETPPSAGSSESFWRSRTCVYLVFFAWLALAAVAGLILPDLLEVPQARAEEWVMILFLPVAAWTAWRLRPPREPSDRAE